ncbi:MAG: methyltransferase domain-containing protein [bacterium]|nr:methyltransferase domain-containing protein [bacterium]
MADYLKETIETYDKTVKEFKKKTQELIPTETLEFMSNIPKNGKILDIGCGFGRDCKVFSENGFSVVGVDLSENMIDAAKGLNGVKFTVMDLRNLKFQKNYFNGAWANAVLLHIRKKDIKKVLLGIHNVLKKGSILFISVKEGTKEVLLKDSRYDDLPKFYAYYKKKELTELLKHAGFEIIDAYYKKMPAYSKVGSKRNIMIFARK